MSLYKYVVFMGIAGTFLLAGCDRGGKKEESKKVAPPPPQAERKQTQPKTVKSDSEKTPVAKAPIEPARPPDPIVARPLPPVEPEHKAAAPAPEDKAHAPSGTLTEKMNETGDYIQHKFEEFTESAAKLGHNVGRQALEVVSPSDESQKRREAIARHAQDTEKSRAVSPDELVGKLDATVPASRMRILAALRPTDETTSLLASLATAPGTDQVAATTGRIVDEIFNEPGMARAKIMKVQLGVRRLAEANLYDENLATRVAYLQATLDERIRDDEHAEVTRDALMIAGTSVALGSIAGFHGFDRAREAVGQMSLSKAIEKGKSGLRSSWDAVSGGTRSAVRSVGRLAHSGPVGFLRRVRLSSQETANRHLLAIGVPEDQVQGLVLKRIGRSEFPIQDFKATNIPGFRFSIVDRIGVTPLNDRRAVIISLVRSERGSGKPVYLVTREMTEDEANALARQIEFRSPEQGGQEFVAVVDAETGEAVGTRMTAHEFREPAEDAQIVAPSPNDGGSAASGARARLSGALQQVTGSARNAASAAVSGTRNVMGAANERMHRAVSRIRPTLQRFDTPWAATVAAGTAIPLYGFYFQGFDEGKRVGQGNQALYLESLVPRERLGQISINLADVQP